MANVIPAKRCDRDPEYNFAVFSVRKGQDVAELESSFVSQSYASMLFERQYSKWGLTDTNFYLVDWENKVILQSFEVWTKDQPVRIIDIVTGVRPSELRFANHAEAVRWLDGYRVDQFYKDEHYRIVEDK